MICLWVVVLTLSALLTARYVWSVLDDIGYVMGARYRYLQIFYGISLTGWWIFWGGVILG